MQHKLCNTFQRGHQQIPAIWSALERAESDCGCGEERCGRGGPESWASGQRAGRLEHGQTPSAQVDLKKHGEVSNQNTLNFTYDTLKF